MVNTTSVLSLSVFFLILFPLLLKAGKKKNKKRKAHAKLTCVKTSCCLPCRKQVNTNHKNNGKGLLGMTTLSFSFDFFERKRGVLLCEATLHQALQ